MVMIYIHTSHLESVYFLVEPRVELHCGWPGSQELRRSINTEEMVVGVSIYFSLARALLFLLLLGWMATTLACLSSYLASLA